MYVSGIDENGLGPRLGPMITTALTVRLGARYDARKWRDRGLESGLTDSKAVAASTKMRFAEGVALAVVRAATGVLPRRTSELLDALHLDGAIGLRAPCPDEATRALCHAADRALPTFGGSVEEGEAALAPLARGRAGLSIVRVRSVVSCAGVLNAEHARGRNKLVVDLAAMERLALDAARAHGEGLVIAGMIGGIRDVPRYATHLPADAYRQVTAAEGARAYEIDGLGRISFEIDADARHLPVALASIVGKYLRELTMLRIVDFHREHDPELRGPSGYHDPVTAGFVERSEPIRRRLAIAPECFERRG